MEYSINDKSKQTEIQAHIQKSSVIIERFTVSVLTSNMRKPHTVEDRAMSAWILEIMEVFVETDENNVPLLLSLNLSTVLDVVPPGSSK